MASSKKPHAPMGHGRAIVANEAEGLGGYRDSTPSVGRCLASVDATQSPLGKEIYAYSNGLCWKSASLRGS